MFGKSRRRSEFLKVAAVVWLAIAAAYAHGAVSATEQWWPYSQFRAVWGFVAGHPEARTTLWQRIVNDTGGVPLRHVVPPAPKAHPEWAYHAVDGLPLTAERGPPLMHLGAGAARGYRILFGVFDFEDTLHGAVLLDPRGRVQRTWQISQNDLTWTHRPDHLIFPHGFEVTREGSIIVAYDSGTSLTKYDYCGRKQWQVEGGFHHSIDLLDDETFWVWGTTEPGYVYGADLTEMSVEDGSIVRSFTLWDIIDANPDIDILGIRQIDAASESTWAEDPFHQNDIDPLPEELARHYPGFKAGDLLVSLRSLNLIFVVDPQSLQVTWWRSGLARRQHDPDWNARGTFTVYNNNMHRGHSSIIEVEPQTLELRTLVDGADYDFYSWHRGKHQVLPDGSVLITSPEQGRVFEVAPHGAVTFDFHNIYSEEHGALGVSEARFLPPDYFRELPTCEG